jgi:hypothetical protein
MNVTVNLLEIASEMAHIELVLQACIEYGISEDVAEVMVVFETEDGTKYKEKYQDKFNAYYDKYYDFVLGLSTPADQTEATPRTEVEGAKGILRKAGFQVDNLWCVEDVRSRFNCTDEEAHEIMHSALTNDATMEQIWLVIEVEGEGIGLTLKSEFEFTLRKSAEDNDLFAPDGGVAVIRFNGEHMVTDYYQEKIDPSWGEEEIWEKLAEGEMYCKDWEGQTELTQEMINDAIEWLGFDPDNVEVTEI